MPIHYTDPLSDVPPGVNFLDAGQVSAWLAVCEVNKPWREPMRKRFADLVRALPPGARVLELGSGPGYLADAVCQGAPQLEQYTLLDFSDHMLELSRKRLEQFTAARFVKADFRTADWHGELNPPFTAILAMQAIHEVRHKRHAPGLYCQLWNLLETDGVLAVCDGTPRDPTILWQESLCMTVDEQFEAFASAGFTDVKLEKKIGAMILTTGLASKVRKEC